MDEPYQSYLTSMSTVGLRQISDFQDVHPQALQGIPESGEWSPAGDPQAPTSGYFQASSVDATKSHQSRKKPAPSNPAGDAVKHRRTRSGCFTCRSRRVKVRYMPMPAPIGRRRDADSSSVTRRGPYVNVCFVDALMQ